MIRVLSSQLSNELKFPIENGKLRSLLGAGSGSNKLIFHHAWNGESLANRLLCILKVAKWKLDRSW